MSEIVHKADELQNADEDVLPELLNDAQRRMITGTTPPEFIKQRKGRGGKMLDYVEVHYIRNQLNQIFGHNWDEEIISKDIGENHIIVQVRLTVRIAGNTVTKDAIGGSDISRRKSDNSVISPADDVKSAVADALKKAASKLGIAEDVYWQDESREKTRTLRGGSKLHRKLEAMLSDYAEKNEYDKKSFRESFKDFLWEWRNIDKEKSMTNLTEAGAAWIVNNEDKVMVQYESWREGNYE